MYCGVQEEWCRAMVTAFEAQDRDQGRDDAQRAPARSMPRSRPRRRTRAPTGGGAAPATRICRAAEEGLAGGVPLAAPGRAAGLGGCRQAEQSRYRTVGIYTGALGFGYNAELLAKRGIAEPRCWADLLDPKYRDEVQVATRIPRARPGPCSPPWCS